MKREDNKRSVKRRSSLPGYNYGSAARQPEPEREERRRRAASAKRAEAGRKADAGPGSRTEAQCGQVLRQHTCSRGTGRLFRLPGLCLSEERKACGTGRARPQRGTEQAGSAAGSQRHPAGGNQPQGGFGSHPRFGGEPLRYGAARPGSNTLFTNG